MPVDERVNGKASPDDVEDRKRDGLVRKQEVFNDISDVVDKPDYPSVKFLSHHVVGCNKTGNGREGIERRKRVVCAA